jgi:hypothetical protein
VLVRAAFLPHPSVKSFLGRLMAAALAKAKENPVFRI